MAAAAALLLALAWGAAPASAVDPKTPDPVAVLSDGILSSKELAELFAGQTVVVRIKEVSPRELAIALACLTDDGPGDVVKRFRDDPHPMAAGSSADWVQPVPVDGAAQALATFDLGPKGESEARRYVDAEPGFGLNLSAAEIARFRALRDVPKASRLQRVDETLREVLAERLAAFARAGLAGTPPYARGDGVESHPAQELDQSYEALRVRPPLFPGFAEAWNDYPRGLPAGAHQQFFVTRADISGRPTAILTHRMELIGEDRAILAERDFYVSQFFDSAVNVVAALPFGPARDHLLVVIERVWVDRWNGMVALKRSIGERKMADHVRELVAGKRVCR